ncbi:MAG: phosphoribosylformylglycinamidine synthase subunit PurQ [Bacteroidia bacterium]|jgi:phosphoribosylformylglycinamidine synthase subunit PurQ / glutaminase|nr:phosphoribosylformylglycinamidine synthase subunit PurQ [Bacteroidota bacterium]MBL7915225.1 phosphoribosylformylglycinamidine synthase subunit PurQ [Bacteroidia bacterium]OQA12121.1 MAG: Phosphoribosylformylglycinamidine synthase 1 [Bacteroidetes bacterium ADurb.Bin397]MBK8872697.1 phosphoribosylformylglycinamidine synthase subunit PurQ [Bacteroidota bacterium]MBK9422723.1 phosphoribosylformylglycinamidine synthase subunit PurQ [Bacteroidota bacterium]
MKFGVVVFPGSNCDRDMQYVLGTVMKQQVEMLWHKEHSLRGCDFIVLPGGFSYGDYLRSGAIARFSPIMQEVMEFADKGGFVLGICNGFQILTEAHLLPGVLMHNDSRQFICKNIYMRAETDESLVTSKLNLGQVVQVPIAHGEGKFFADDATLLSLRENNQVLFRYCDAAGNLSDAANPNGATDHIAGICNKGRNVFGMMPHPERAADPVLGNTDGRLILDSILNMVEM